MVRKQAILVLLALATVAIALAACSNEPSPFATTTPVPPTSSVPTPTHSPSDSLPPGAGDAAAGEQLFTTNACSTCHSTGSNQIVGPGLSGVAVKGEEYLRQSIVDPAAVIVEGFSPLMPANFNEIFTDQEVSDIVAYLLTLQ